MKLTTQSIYNTVLIILLSALFVSSCTKKDDIGKELVELPGDILGVDFTDTFTVVSFSSLVDSFSTDEIGGFMLGSYYDTEMGVTTTSFYTQIRMVTNDIEYGSNAVFDSIVLTLGYNFIYGEDSLTPQMVRVYELDEDVYWDSTYHSNDVFQVKSPEIGVANVIFNNIDSVYEGDEKEKAHLRIRLDDAFGLKIFAKSGQPELSDNDEFLKFIKGLYVTADKMNSPGGAIGGINLLSSLSQMAIYYHDDTSKLVSNFVINENSARIQSFNHYDYQDASASFINQVINEDSSLGAQRFYLQSMAGVKAAIRFPYIKELVKDGPIGLNKAELILQPDLMFMDFEGPPLEIVLVKQTAEGSYVYPKDEDEGETFYGGIYDKTTKQYYFTITRHLQGILTGDEQDYGMYLMVKGGGVLPYRVVFNGSEASNRVRLRLYYTEV